MKHETNKYTSEVNELMAIFGFCGNPDINDLKNATRQFGNDFLIPLSKIVNAEFSNYTIESTLPENSFPSQLEYKTYSTYDELVAQQNTGKSSAWDFFGNLLNIADQAAGVYNKVLTDKSNSEAIGQSPDQPVMYTMQQPESSQAGLFSNPTTLLIIAAIVVLAGLFIVFKSK